MSEKPPEHDVLVIGTGGAGVAAAIQAANMGATVAIVEAGVLGGTCVNVGCIPSKNLIEAAAHYHDARRGFPGIAPCEPTLDWPAVLQQKEALTGELRHARYADVLQALPGVTVLRGRAELVDAGTVRVGDAIHTARRIIVATGTSPELPPIEGLDAVEPLTSTSAMELQVLPESLIVLGAGSVGLELGQMFARFGVRVIVLELQPRILPTEEPAIADRLRGYLEAEGLEIHTGVRASRVARSGGQVVVRVEQGSMAGEFRAERILAATGRTPNTRDMGLERAGVALTPRGFVQVDAAMCSSNPRILAAGDVTGGPGYVYVAAAGGRVAAENAVNSLRGDRLTAPRQLDLTTVPGVTFTSPQVASVGILESSARAAGRDVQVTSLTLDQVPRALVNHDTRGLVMVVAEAGSGRLVGFHAVAPHAGEMLGEATLAIRFGLTAADLTGMLHAYLTWGEGVRLAAQGFTADVARLSCCA
ncbi:MAG TPA: mercury(II) reductase [Gemmatimonadaceae bacterium]|nr:mercury(II) reductase [Gemmatimonadaceae bacterium]